MTCILKKALWLSGLMALGLALASASPSSAEAATKCKSGYEKIGGKCVKRCKKGQGRRNGVGKCITLCKKNQMRDLETDKCITVMKLPVTPEECNDNNLAECDTVETCHDNTWADVTICRWGFHWEGEQEGGGCFFTNQTNDATVIDGSCEGS
jgi:hypothetical protein